MAGGAVHSRPYTEAAYRDYASVLQPEDVRFGVASLQMTLWAKRDSDWGAAVDYSSAALTVFDREGSMNQGEHKARQ